MYILNRWLLNTGDTDIGHVDMFLWRQDGLLKLKRW